MMSLDGSRDSRLDSTRSSRARVPTSDRRARVSSVFPALYLCTRVVLYRFQSIWSTFRESDLCVDIETNTHESSLE